MPTAIHRQVEAARAGQLARVVARKKSTTPELWRFYWDTIEACIPPATVMDALRCAGFTQVQRHVEMGIFSEYTATKPS